MTSTNPQSDPTSGRVSKVNAITEIAAAPTIKTHLKTAASLNFISSSLSYLSRPEAAKIKSG